MQSRASRNVDDASFGKERRLTGTLKQEISETSQASSPSGESLIISLRASAAELPGLELVGRPAGEVMEARCPAVVRGGRKDRVGEEEAAVEGS